MSDTARMANTPLARLDEGRTISIVVLGCALEQLLCALLHHLHPGLSGLAELAGST